MADDTKSIKEVGSNKIKLLISKIKNTFYAGSRSDTREIPPEETDIFKKLQKEMNALSELQITLEHIELKYWTINKRDGSGNVIRDDSTFESYSEEIDEQTAKLGYYENREIAEDERRYYRYSSAKRSNEEIIQMRVEDLIADPSLAAPGELEELNKLLAQMAEEYQKVEADPRKQTKVRDPWENFQVIKMRFLPKGFVEKLWGKYQKREVISLEEMHDDALFVLRTKINADKKIIDDTERAINEYYEKEEYEKTVEVLEIQTSKNSNIKISNLPDLIRISFAVIESTENGKIPQYNFDNFFVKNKNIITNWLNKNYKKVDLGNELSNVNDLKDLKLFAAKLNAMMSRKKAKLPLSEEVFKMAYKEIFELRIPPEKRIEFPDGSIHYMRCWGFAYISPHKGKFEDITDHIMINYKHYFHDILKYEDIIKLDGANRELRTEDVKKNLEVIRNKMHRYINEVFNLIGSEDIKQSELDGGAVGRGGYEFDMRKYANRALGYYTGDYKTRHLKELRQNKIGAQKDTKPHVWCKHSYRIFIFPYYDTEEERGLFPPKEPRKDMFKRKIGNTLLDDIEAYKRAIKDYEIEYGEFKARLNDKKIIPVIEQQKGLEYQPGWDENGMPLEVEDRGLSGNEFSSKGKAKVLVDMYKIDLYNGKKERGKNEEAEGIGKTIPKLNGVFHIREIDEKIYKKCTAYMSLSLMKEYIEIEWDNFRDDIRDGRYHTNSMTAYDYTSFIMGKHMPFADAESKIDRGEIDNETLSKIRKYTMKITEDGTKYWDFQDIRKASNLNPAFDRRALKSELYKNWKFPGRIFYYTYSMPGNIDSDILPKKYDPHVTTRGLSMYIIHKVLSQTMYLDEARRVLNYIRENKTKGFDYGPRNYTQSWERDPTNIDFSNIKV